MHQACRGFPAGKAAPEGPPADMGRDQRVLRLKRPPLQATPVGSELEVAGKRAIFAVSPQRRGERQIGNAGLADGVGFEPTIRF